MRALEHPIRQIATHAGAEGSIVMARGRGTNVNYYLAVLVTAGPSFYAKHDPRSPDTWGHHVPRWLRCARPSSSPLGLAPAIP